MVQHHNKKQFCFVNLSQIGKQIAVKVVSAFCLYNYTISDSSSSLLKRDTPSKKEVMGSKTQTTGCQETGFCKCHVRHLPFGWVFISWNILLTVIVPHCIFPLDLAPSLMFPPLPFASALIIPCRFSIFFGSGSFSSIELCLYCNMVHRQHEVFLRESACGWNRWTAL